MSADIQAFQAVLFDLDGTLLDTIEDLTDSMNAALAAVGLPPRTLSECKVFVGDGVETFARRAIAPARLDKEAYARLMEAYRKDYSTRWAVKTRPYDGIPEMLDALAARGLKLSVLSNKPDEFTRVVVAKFLPKWRFDAVAGATASVPKKPDPSAALRIACELGVEPARFLYLGDTNTDMRTAVAAGMYPVGVLWGFRTAEELRTNGAKVLIERPADVLRLL